MARFLQEPLDLYPSPISHLLSTLHPYVLEQTMPEHLWAPWRMEYVEQPSESGQDNIFVRLPALGDDRKHFILHRGEMAFVMLNAYPYTTGHPMIAPYRQSPSIEELNDQELLEINQLLAASIRWLKKAYKPEGFNVGVNLGRIAGAGIPSHVHWHVVPRWGGDTNFMTAIGDTRVHPEGLEASYDRIKRAIDI